MIGPKASEDVRSLHPRLQFLAVVMSLAFLGLLGRLFQLQILEAEHFSRRAEKNFTDTIEVDAPRGRIFDQKGRVLATNRPAYSLYVTAWPRVEVEEKEGRFTKRVQIDDASIDDLSNQLLFADQNDRDKFVARVKRLRAKESDGRYPVLVRSNLSWSENARIQTRGRFASWVEIRESARREYPAGSTAAFVTGYMREIGPKQLEASSYGDYRPGDRVGKTGIERQWENYLRGRLGSRSRVVNNIGLPVLEPPVAAVAALPLDRDPIPGQDIYLSLDLALQEVAEKEFASRRAGGLVAMEVHSGRILAMLSVPSIDPNLWERPIKRKDFDAWLKSPFKPFVDKTVQDNFFPGSTYKVISALAALEDPSFDPDEEIECTGRYEFGGRVFRDSHRHGMVALEQAITESCNVYFYKLAAEGVLSMSRMEAAARRFGLGERTGVGINSEVRGVVPTQALEARQGRFQRGVNLNNALGQGNVKTTILQIAMVYATLANGGYVMTPYLVDRVETADGKVVLEGSSQRKNAEPVIAPFDRERIHRGLVGVVQSELGTAHKHRLENVKVAGKTGTAQVGIEKVSEDEKGLEGWDVTQPHSWFAAYAPADEPEIVVVALVAHGGAGAEAAAPIVMRVIDDYLEGRGSDSYGRRRKSGEAPPLPGQGTKQGANSGGSSRRRPSGGGPR